MIATNVRIKNLKQKFEDSAVSHTDKMEIIEFFQNFNDIFYSGIDIDAFFKQLKDLEKQVG